MREMSSTEEVIARLEALRAYPHKYLTDPQVNDLRRAATAALTSLPDHEIFLADLLEKEFGALNGSGDLLVCVVLHGVLAERKAREAVPIFNRMLTDPRTLAMHEDLAETLGQMGDASSVPWLIDALSSEEVWVRAKAARSLGHLADSRAIAPLTLLLKKDESDTVRENAIKALAEANASEASSTLLELAARPDEATDVRTTAIRALGRMRNRNATSLLVKLGEHDKDEDVREAAAEVLATLQRAE
jgi:HEAT repeat protein